MGLSGSSKSTLVRHIVSEQRDFELSS